MVDVWLPAGGLTAYVSWLGLKVSESTTWCCPAFVRWTGELLRCTLSQWQHHKHCPGLRIIIIIIIIIIIVIINPSHVAVVTVDVYVGIQIPRSVEFAGASCDQYMLCSEDAVRDQHWPTVWRPRRTELSNRCDCEQRWNGAGVWHSTRCGEGVQPGR